MFVTRKYETATMKKRIIGNKSKRKRFVRFWIFKERPKKQ